MINQAVAPGTRRSGHWGRWVLLFLILGLLAFVYIRYYYPLGEGTKAGILNTFMKKGYVFKTYEGKIIQSGFKTGVQSIEFNFTVTDEAVATQLMQHTGEEVRLEYDEYFASPFWRGQERFVVRRVLNVGGNQTNTSIVPQQ